MTQEQYLLMALSLAQNANRANIKGNPFVGAIIVDENDSIIGSGYHQKWGEKHAEVFAIEEALLNTADLSNCTLYVTLEPCSHHGKTPPCTNLIVQTGIKKVVVGSVDPNPAVSGIQRLKEKGIEVIVHEILEAKKLNKVFFTNQQKNRPFVRLKMAATLDGKIADYAGTSKWITNVSSRAFLHESIRANVDAIVSTAKTVLADQATLNIRIEGSPNKELNAVIIDRTGSMLQEVHAAHPIFYNRSETNVYIITAPGTIDANNPLPTNTIIIEIPFNNNNEIDLGALSKALLEKGLYSVLIEAGAIFNSFLLANKWVDEIDYFIGSKILLDNNAKAGFNLSSNTPLQNSTPLTLLASKTLENDIYLHYAIDAL